MVTKLKYGNTNTYFIRGAKGTILLDTELLITHTYPLSQIDEAYELFENKRDGVIKVAVEC